MRLAEAGWVRAIISEMTSGGLGDLDMWRRILKTGEIPQELRDLEEEARRRWAEPGAQE
jgi:hypothetical protein